MKIIHKSNSFLALSYIFGNGKVAMPLSKFYFAPPPKNMSLPLECPPTNVRSGATDCRIIGIIGCTIKCI